MFFYEADLPFAFVLRPGTMELIKPYFLDFQERESFQSILVDRGCGLLKFSPLEISSISLQIVVHKGD